jgi:hypothetical protein
MARQAGVGHRGYSSPVRPATGLGIAGNSLLDAGSAVGWFSAPCFAVQGAARNDERTTYGLDAVP